MFTLSTQPTGYFWNTLHFSHIRTLKNGHACACLKAVTTLRSQILCNSHRSRPHNQYIIQSKRLVIQHTSHTTSTCFGTELPSSGSYYITSAQANLPIYLPLRLPQKHRRTRSQYTTPPGNTPIELHIWCKSTPTQPPTSNCCQAPVRN